ncbi:Hypothetical predicted protein [Mytilus galloprovincialis]|uniref:MRH domain-containing protein n=1 Tax=Mytilus galloprovincialis TaxID=29158 RepID=A0A8B6DZS7_MYTGA|nr:Hypothetical predicted protein [Mytilus galloprovincialis]
MVETLFLFILTIVITSARNDNKVYSEDDVYISNSSTTRSSIPTDCNLFGNKFEADYPVQKININITETGTFWVGARIGFERNINPLGVLTACNDSRTGSLDECNRHCEGHKYFSYNEDSCSCLKSNHVDVGLSKTKICKHPQNGLCYEDNCVVYERDVVNDAYMCDVYYFESLVKDWIFTTEKCSLKLNFICDGDNPSSDAMNTSWLVAEQTCSKKNKHLLQKTKIPGNEFKDGTKYWVSFFRRKNISWGIGGDKDVCAAITIFPNRSVSLVSRFCTDQLATLCHIHKLQRDHQNTTANGDSSPLGLIVGCCVGFLAVIAMFILFIIFKRRNVKKRKLRYLESVIRDHDTEYTEYDNPMEDNSDHMYKSTDVTKPSCSDYSLAVTYSDPINSVLPKNIKSIPETEYESIAMTPPKTKQIYPVENPYQSPYS